MLFQATNNMSELAGFTRGRRMNIHVYSIVCRSVRVFREIKPGSKPPLSAAHICKYKASYVQSRGELPPTAPQSRALIVIVA